MVEHTLHDIAWFLFGALVMRTYVMARRREGRWIVKRDIDPPR